MKCFESVAEWREFRANMEPSRASLGFVPTMGALHAGHTSLLTQSKSDNAYTALSIFVNPTQFNEAKDLKNYPVTLAQDLDLARAAGVDFVLLPKYAELYPDQYRYQIKEIETSQILCGAHRPGHFEGMLSVVMKLLNLVRAKRAYFGEKDFQQLQLVRGMVEAFFIETEIIACPTVREADGLAMSSRNLRLTPNERAQATLLPKILFENLSLAESRQRLADAGFRVEYVENWGGRKLAAVHLGQVRLIDNVKT